jgi:hypothetical protein
MLSNSAQPLSYYEIAQREHSIPSFIETYKNELPLLVIIKKGSLEETDSNSLDTDQVISLSLSLSLSLCMYSFKMQQMT